MGPRSWSRGRPSGQRTTDHGRRKLQWGQDVGVVEDPTDNGQLTTDEGSFNGATTLESRKTSRKKTGNPA